MRCEVCRSFPVSSRLTGLPSVSEQDSKYKDCTVRFVLRVRGKHSFCVEADLTCRLKNLYGMLISASG